MKQNIKVSDLMKITGKDIGTRIKQVRGNDSQEKASKKTGVSIAALRGYELNKNEPSLTAIKKIAKAYCVNPILIAFGDEQNLIDDEKLDMINRIMMLDKKEKETLKEVLKAMEIQCVLKRQQEKQK